MNKIRYYREQKGYSMKEFASMVGISVGHLCHLEKETKLPSRTSMELIAYALDMEVPEIFYSNDEVFEHVKER